MKGFTTFSTQFAKHGFPASSLAGLLFRHDSTHVCVHRELTTDGYGMTVYLHGTPLPFCAESICGTE